MKILVMSDSHRKKAVLEEIIKSNIDADEFVFLGDGKDDIEGCLRKIPDLSRKSVRIVCGNCDGLSERPDEIIFECAGHKILCTHGHLFNVKRGFEWIVEEAWEKRCDIVLYGHTHEVNYCDDYQDVKLFNPGAVLDNYYGIIMFDENSGETEFLHKRFETTRQKK